MRPDRLAFALCLLCFGPALAGPAEDAARGLFDGSVTPEDAAQTWEQAKLEPQEAVELLRGLALEEPPAGDHSAKLTDGYGRESEAQIRMPADGPDEHGRYRAAVILHGIGGDSKQGLKIAVDLAPPHTIVIAPSARQLSGDDKAEDLRTASLAKIPIMKGLKHWWSYKPHAFSIAALDYLKRHYALDTNRVVLIGYSMGGFGTWNVGLRYPDYFAGLMPMAGGISREEFALGQDDYCRQLLFNGQDIPLFFVHGDKDEVVPVDFDRRSDEALKKLHVKSYTYHEVAGGKHVMTDQLATNSPLIKELTDWLDARVRDPHPHRLRHLALGTYHGDDYWLRIDAIQGAAASVEAQVGKHNRMRIQTHGVKGLTVFLDPELFKLGRRSTKLAIELDGKAQAYKLKPSLQAVADSWARRRDPELLYTYELHLDVEPKDVQDDSGGWGELLKRWKGGQKD